MTGKKFDLNDVRKIQQGDVIFERVDFVPDDVLQNGKKTVGSVTLALGEATGHSHDAVGETLTSYRLNNLTFVVVGESDAVARHDTHHSAPLVAGTTWKVSADGETGSLREVDHFRDEVIALQD